MTNKSKYLITTYRNNEISIRVVNIETGQAAEAKVIRGYQKTLDQLIQELEDREKND